LTKKISVEFLTIGLREPEQLVASNMSQCNMLMVLSPSKSLMASKGAKCCYCLLWSCSYWTLWKNSGEKTLIDSSFHKPNSFSKQTWPKWI